MKRKNNLLTFSFLFVFFIFAGFYSINTSQVFADTFSSAILSCTVQSVGNTSGTTPSNSSESVNSLQNTVTQQQIDQENAIAQQTAVDTQQQIDSMVQNTLSGLKTSTDYYIQQFKSSVGQYSGTGIASSAGTSQTPVSSNSTGVSGVNSTNGNSASATNTTGTTASTVPTPVTIAPTGSTCPVLGVNLKLGSSGTGVLALSNVLVSEGLLSAPTSTFDKTVFNAVVAYQQKYADQILKPLNLSVGTGFVGSATRNYMNAHPSCLAPVGNFRYLRVDMVRNEWLVLNEIEIYDTAGRKLAPISATASATLAGQSAGLAIDRNNNTYWSSGETNTLCQSQCGASCVVATRSAYIIVDLGSVQNVAKVRLYDQGWISGEVTKLSVSNTNNSYSNFAPLATFTDNQSCAVSTKWLEYSAVNPAIVSSCQAGSVAYPDAGSTPVKTTTVTAPATAPVNSCPNFWWYDSQTVVCTQKQFCGLNYEYNGLMIFTSQSACQISSSKSQLCKLNGSQCN